MKIQLDNTEPSKKKTELLCLFVLEDSILGLKKGSQDADIYAALKQAQTEVKEIGKTSTLFTLDRTPAKRILLAGLGKSKNMTKDTIRFVSGKIAQKARELGVQQLSIVAPPDNVADQKSSVTQIIEGIKLSLYKFDKFKSDKEGIQSKKLQSVSIIVDPSLKEQLDKVANAAEKITEGVIFTRDVANLPPNQCFPSTLSDIAKKIATKNKIKCTVLSKQELKKRGFGGITAVGQGSKNEPKLIILEYYNGRKNEKPFVVVGKAVTFDTGGISLKPSEKMDEMKFDKCGGCTILGIMKAASDLKLPINLVGLIPAVENMPGGESYRPGDIIKLYSGKTAEILNTDAEGRLILADALSFGEKKYSPKAMIDFATLTGACIVALGNNVAGMISNDKQVAKQIKQSSERTMEEVWQLPLNNDYMDMIKSEVADMKNTGIGRAAGTITAAAFLKKAVDNTPWIHFDIAGAAWTQQATKEKPYNPRGATGFGVRLVLDYLIESAKLQA